MAVLFLEEPEHDPEDLGNTSPPTKEQEAAQGVKVGESEIPPGQSPAPDGPGSTPA